MIISTYRNSLPASRRLTARPCVACWVASPPGRTWQEPEPGFCTARIEPAGSPNARAAAISAGVTSGREECFRQKNWPSYPRHAFPPQIQQEKNLALSRCDQFGKWESRLAREESRASFIFRHIVLRRSQSRENWPAMPRDKAEKSIERSFGISRVKRFAEILERAAIEVPHALRPLVTGGSISLRSKKNAGRPGTDLGQAGNVR